MASFTAEQLAAIDAARTVRVETRRTPESPTHRTTIWIVVEDGQVFVRSVRGERGRWYRDLLQVPDGTLHVARQAIPVRAEPAADPAAIEACSRGLERSYAGDPSLASMLRPNVLASTLRLRPQEG